MHAQSLSWFYSSQPHALRCTRLLSYIMGENTCKQCNQQGLNFQIIQTAHTTQHQRNQQAYQKMGRRLQQTCLQIQMANSHMKRCSTFTNYGASLVIQLEKNLSGMQETPVGPLGWEDPLEESMAIRSNILAWSIHMDRGAWQAIVHEVTKRPIDT